MATTWRAPLLLVVSIGLLAASACGGSGSHDTLPVPSIIAISTPAGATAQLTKVGSTLQLSADITDGNGVPIPPTDVIWTSTTSTVATVGKAGLVTAAGYGTTTVTAKLAKLTATLNVHVVQVVDHVTLKAHGGASTKLTALGDLLQLDAAVLDSINGPVAGATIAFSACDGSATSTPCESTVVSVSEEGFVTALANGTSTVQASSSGKSAFLTVSVQQETAQLTLLPGTETIGSGRTAQFTVTLTDANGKPVTTDAVTWTSSDETVATIDATGLATSEHVSALSTTIITASVKDAGGEHSSTATLTVDPNLLPVAKIVLSGSTSLARLGGTLTLTAAASEADNTPLPSAKFVWESSAPTVATVTPTSAGAATATVTAVSNGSTTIHAISNGVDAAVTVTVSQVMTQVKVEVSGTPTSIPSLGGTLQLRAADAGGAAMPAAGVTWAICDGTTAPPCTPTIATIGSAGLVTAVKNGGARVTATAGLASATLDIVVSQQVASVTAKTKSTTLTAFNATVQLYAQDARGNDLAFPLTWTSSAALATVDSAGLVSAKGNGSASIKAALPGGSDPGKTLTVTVTIPITSVAIAPLNPSAGGGLPLTFSVVAKDASGNIISPPGTVTWSTTPTTVASISAAGVATGLVPGTTTVKAVLGALSSTTLLTVTSYPFSTAATSGAGQAITVVKGTQVKWSNPDIATHSVLSDSGSAFPINTGTFGQGATTAPITFSAAGTFGYHCGVHGTSEKGTITVTP